MWFKRKKKRKINDGLREAEKIEYVSADTELGRQYNKALNKHYTEALYSDALNYEMQHLVIQHMDMLGERIVMLEERMGMTEERNKEDAKKI